MRSVQTPRHWPAPKDLRRGRPRVGPVLAAVAIHCIEVSPPLTSPAQSVRLKSAARLFPSDYSLPDCSRHHQRPWHLGHIKVRNQANIAECRRPASSDISGNNGFSAMPQACFDFTLKYACMLYQHIHCRGADIVTSTFFLIQFHNLRASVMSANYRPFGHARRLAHSGLSCPADDRPDGHLCQMFQPPCRADPYAETINRQQSTHTLCHKALWPAAHERTHLFRNQVASERASPVAILHPARQLPHPVCS